MKKRTSVALVTVLCVALLVCAAGCSNSDNDKVVGSWTVVGINVGEEVLTGNDLSMLGEETTVLINDNGTCSFDTAGTVVDGKWELSGDTITFTIDGETMNGAVNGNSIVIEDVLTLERTPEE